MKNYIKNILHNPNAKQLEKYYQTQYENLNQDYKNTILNNCIILCKEREYRHILLKSFMKDDLMKIIILDYSNVERWKTIDSNSMTDVINFFLQEYWNYCNQDQKTNLRQCFLTLSDDPTYTKAILTSKIFENCSEEPIKYEEELEFSDNTSNDSDLSMRNYEIQNDFPSNSNYNGLLYWTLVITIVLAILITSCFILIPSTTSELPPLNNEKSEKEYLL